MELYRLVHTAGVMVYSVSTASGQTLDEVASPNDLDGALQTKMCHGRWRSEDVLKSMSCELVVSERLFDRIKTLRLPERTRFFDVDIINVRGRIVGRYKVVDYLRPYFDVVNTQRSRCDFAGSVLLTVRDMVVDPQRVPDYDLLPIKPTDWIATLAFARIISDEITGIRLDRVALEPVPE